jgi:perosamine synthetase
MAVTNSQALADRLREIGSFCYGKKNRFQHEDIGFNYRLPNISAAMGLGQFRRIEAILTRTRVIHDAYSERPRKVPGLRLPLERPWAKSVLWMFNLSLDPTLGIALEDFMAGMERHNIEVREAFVPINRQKVLLERGWVREDECPVANKIMETGFYLPSGLGLTPQQIDRVCDAVVDVLRMGPAAA